MELLPLPQGQLTGHTWGDGKHKLIYEFVTTADGEDMAEREGIGPEILERMGSYLLMPDTKRAADVAFLTSTTIMVGAEKPLKTISGFTSAHRYCKIPSNAASLIQNEPGKSAIYRRSLDGNT